MISVIFLKIIDNIGIETKTKQLRECLRISIFLINIIIFY